MHAPGYISQITETRSEDGLRLRWRWRTPLSDLLSVLLLAGIVGRVVVASGVPVWMDLSLVAMVGVAVQVWRNVSTVEVNREGLTLADGPVFGGRTRLERREIAGLRIVEQRINWLRQYTLVADVHRNGRLEEVVLVIRTPRGAVLRHLEQRIKAGLLGRA